MNEADTPSDLKTREPASAGALLRAARDRQGLHIAALAAAIKVAPRKLEALEADRWEELPGPTFTRALAQTVCRSLKIDAREVLELLPPADTSVLDSRVGNLNEPFAGHPGRGVQGETGLAALRLAPLAAAAVIVAFAALLVFFVPGAAWTGLAAWVRGHLATAAAPVEATTASVSRAGPLPSEPASAPGAAVPPAAGPSSAVLPATPPPTSAPPGTGAAAGLAAGDAPASPPASSGASSGATAGRAAPEAPADAAGSLQLVATADTWVEVRDARGRSLLSRTVNGGERLGLDGEVPLRLLVGNAGATEVRWRGQPVDLAGRTRDNVARIELK